MEVERVAHVGVCERRAGEHGILSFGVHRQGTVDFAERGVRLTQHTSILFIVRHYYLVARKAVAMGQRQRHVVGNIGRSTRYPDESVAIDLYVVGVLTHQSCGGKRGLVRGDERKWELVMNPGTAVFAEMLLTGVTAHRYHVARLRTYRDRL